MASSLPPLKRYSAYTASDSNANQKNLWEHQQYRLLEEYLQYTDIDENGDRIVCDGDELAHVVTWHLNQGWELHGSPISVFDGTSLCHMQAVVKKTWHSKKIRN